MLQEFEISWWYLEKIQEVLPICMFFGKVKTGEAQWQDVVGYLNNAHGRPLEDLTTVLQRAQARIGRHRNANYTLLRYNSQ
jgi:hypothetical protein